MIDDDAWLKRPSRNSRKDLARAEVEERLLLGPDLVDVDAVEAGLVELVDRLAVALGVGPADDRRCDLLAA